MFRTFRIIRIIISLVSLAVPTWALLWGYQSVFARMQIFTAIFAGVAVTLVFWLAVTLIYGRIYCSTVCPLGTFSDCVGASVRLARRRKPSFAYASPARRTQGVLLALALAAILSGSAFLPTLFDPYTAYARMVENLIARPLGLNPTGVAYTGTTLAVALATAAGVMAASWRRGRLMCNTVCPIGTILGIGSRRSLYHIEIDPDACTLCGKCESVCKAQCIKLPDKVVDTSRCVVCFDCTAACPNEAITYRTGHFRLDIPMMQATDGAAKSCTKPTATGCAKCSRKKSSSK